MKEFVGKFSWNLLLILVYWKDRTPKLSLFWFFIKNLEYSIFEMP